MALNVHEDVSIQYLTIGEEKAPLLVIDNFISNPDSLVEQAADLDFEPPKLAYPGIRALAPRDYQRFLLTELGRKIIDYFELKCRTLQFTMCHYSLITMPPEELSLAQRIPHIDSFDPNGLATIHYLFRERLGGTAFYRHRNTGYEIIDEARKMTYFKSLESEMLESGVPASEYINGDTRLFKQIGKQEGIFNRLLVYRRNSLHSGCIDQDFVPDSNPLTGRLSINSFIDLV